MWKDCTKVSNKVSNEESISENWVVAHKFKIELAYLLTVILMHQ